MAHNNQRSPAFKTPSLVLASRSTKGLAAELYFASIMLSNGYELYQPLVDVAIDYLAKSWNGRELLFQCKSRLSIDEKGFSFSIPKDENVKRPTHIFFMLGDIPDPEFWIVPYEVVKKHSKKFQINSGRSVRRLILSPAVLAIFEKYKKQDGLLQLRDWCLYETEESA